MQSAPLGDGLSSEAARRKLGEVGPNVLAAGEGPHWLGRLGRNFTHLFALLLWTGAGLALLGDQPPLAVAIVGVIVVNAVFSFAQEHRAERAVEALRHVLPQRARVRRDGRPTELDSQELVPGDVMLLAPGDRISADGDVLVAAELAVDMSTLTGESRAIHRQVRYTASGSLDDPGRVFAGTHVVAGSGEARVTTTGMATELGRIARLTRREPRRASPLEVEMRRMTRVVAVLSVSIGTVVFALAGTLGMTMTDRFIFAIGVIVATVPEGLLPTVTLSLAMATQRMAGRNAIVRRLSAVEALGATTVICTDKTGTLTVNQMTVRNVWMPGAELGATGAGYSPRGELATLRGHAAAGAVAELARAGALCNDAAVEESGGRWQAVGDPTEAALVTLARKAGVDPVDEAARLPRVDEAPFDSVRKRMTTVHDGPAGRVAYVKGAPSAIVSRSTLDDAGRATVLAAAEAMARQALRVLAVARRTDCPAHAPAQALEAELELLGLVGMEDPPRPEAAEAVRTCRQAGIHVLMVTGDDGATAEAIARRIGLVEDEAEVVDGHLLEELDDRELADRLHRPGAIVSRVAPEQKLRIAAALRASGDVVAMTGDGVNDAPALRAADIGVAMGRGGTDVAREAADIVLLDDNFATIAAAVEEGRAVYDNIRRFAQYHFSSNVAELMAFLTWGLSGGTVPLPLVVMQVLAIDLGTDLLPAIALGTEKPEPGVMQRAPRPRSERLLNVRVLARVFGFVGLLVGVAGLASFFAGYALSGWSPGETLSDQGGVYVQATAMTYAGIVMGQVGAALAFRTNRQSVFSVGILSNRVLLWGIAFELVLLVAILEIGPLQRVFHTTSLDPRAWVLLVVWPAMVLLADEARKAFIRHRHVAGTEAEERSHGTPTGLDAAPRSASPAPPASPPAPGARRRRAQGKGAGDPADDRQGAGAAERSDPGLPQ